jgi:hypothetical protein
MKPTDVLTLANGIRKKNESLIMLRRVKAASAFQKRDGKGPAGCHGRRSSKQAEATVTTPTSR